jgi:hypothetical protein
MGGVPICLIGAVGFATVAIGVGPFVYSMNFPSECFASLGPGTISVSVQTQMCSPIGSKLSGAVYIRIAAGDRAKVHQLASLAQRNGKRFIHMHAANGVLYQPPRCASRLGCGSVSQVLLRGKLGLPEQPANEAAQQPHAPGEYQQPEQEPRDTSKHGHKVFKRGAMR